MNLAGEAITVAALGKLLGVEASGEIDPLYRHVVVLAGAAAGIGLLVDRVENVGTVDTAGVTAVSPENSLNGCVIGRIEIGAGTVHLLDAERIFLAAEQARLDALQSA